MRYLIIADMLGNGHDQCSDSGTVLTNVGFKSQGAGHYLLGGDCDGYQISSPDITALCTLALGRAVCGRLVQYMPYHLHCPLRRPFLCRDSAGWTRQDSETLSGGTHESSCIHVQMRTVVRFQLLLISGIQETLFAEVCQVTLIVGRMLLGKAAGCLSGLPAPSSFRQTDPHKRATDARRYYCQCRQHGAWQYNNSNCS